MLINASVPEKLSLTTLANSDRLTKLKELFSRIFCCPATSAVERVISQSGLIMRPHRACMTNPAAGDSGILKMQQWCINSCGWQHHF